MAKLLLGVALVALALSMSLASHGRFGNLSWKRKIDPATGQPIPGKIIVNVRVAYNQAGNCNSPRVNGYIGAKLSSCSTGNPNEYYIRWGEGSNTLMLVTCTSNSSAEQWAYYETPFERTYSGSGSFTVYHQDCCRMYAGVPNVQSSSASYRFETIVPSMGDLTNLGGPVTTLSPIQDVYTDDPAATVQLRASDPDEDALTYSWTSNTGASSSQMTNGQNLSPNPMQLNPTTGLITWDTRGFNTGLYQIATTITDTKGATTGLDFFVRLSTRPRYCTPQCATNTLTCTAKSQCCTDPNCPTGCSCAPATPPVVSGPATLKVARNCLLQFTVTASSPYQGSLLSMVAVNMPLSATGFQGNVARKAPHAQTISWTPTSADVGVRVVCFSATDQNKLKSKDYCVTITITNDLLYLLTTEPDASSKWPSCGAVTTRWFDQAANLGMSLLNKVKVEICTTAAAPVCSVLGNNLPSAATAKFNGYVPPGQPLGKYTVRVSSTTQTATCIAPGVSPPFDVTAKTSGNLVVSTPGPAGVLWQQGCNSTVAWADIAVDRQVELSLCEDGVTPPVCTVLATAVPSVANGANLFKADLTNIKPGRYTLKMVSLPRDPCEDTFTTPAFAVVAPGTYSCTKLADNNARIVREIAGTTTNNLGTVMGVLAGCLALMGGIGGAMYVVRRRQQAQFAAAKKAAEDYDPNKDYDPNAGGINPSLQEAAIRERDAQIEDQALQNAALRQEAELREAQRAQQLTQLATLKQTNARRAGRNEFDDFGDADGGGRQAEF